MSRSVLGIGLVVLVGVAAGAEFPQAPPPRRIPVEELVEQLGTGPVPQREAAEARLSALAFDPPPPELLAALKSSSLDRRERAARIIQAMRWNVAATRLPRGERFAEQGRVDLFVAATAVWDLKADDERLWVPAQDLGRRLIEKAEMKGDRKPHNCPSSFKDFATYKRLFGPRFTRVDELYIRPDPRDENPPILYRNEAIQAPGVTDPEGISNAIIASRGSVQTHKALQKSVVFANGDVTVRNVLLSSVIVCDGDVTVTDSDVWKTLVIARGNITVERGAECAVLVAGGKVTVKAQRKLRPEQFNVIKENEPNPLDYITFFELSTVGVAVKVADKVVTVSAVAAGKPGDKAGVKVGDIVLDVNGKKPADVEALRRHLRDALAVGDATIKVRRGNDTLTLKVALPE